MGGIVKDSARGVSILPFTGIQTHNVGLACAFSNKLICVALVAWPWTLGQSQTEGRAQWVPSAGVRFIYRFVPEQCHCLFVVGPGAWLGCRLIRLQIHPADHSWDQAASPREGSRWPTDKREKQGSVFDLALWAVDVLYRLLFRGDATVGLCFRGLVSEFLSQG